MKLLLALLAITAAALAPCDARAHSRPLSYSFWKTSVGGAEVRVQIRPDDLALLGFDVTKAPEEARRAGAFLERNLELHADGVHCAPEGPPAVLTGSEPWVSFRWTVRCPAPGDLRISAGFVGRLGGHRHLVRLENQTGPPLDRVLDVSEPEWPVGKGGAAAAATGSSLGDYVALGVEHLLTGWDHLAFVFALLLLARRLRDVVALVTSFTCAHSITLALAALRLAEPDPAPVEALIGFSIALVGAENAWLLSGRPRSIPFAIVGGLTLMTISGGTVGTLALLGLILFCACHFALLGRYEEPAALRNAIAFAFGLVHGFGFAAVMGELDLPTDRLVPALFGFNIGVELAQLAVVLLVWPALRALGRVHGGRWSVLVSEGASAAICGLGVFWFVVRAHG